MSASFLFVFVSYIIDVVACFCHTVLVAFLAFTLP